VHRKSLLCSTFVLVLLGGYAATVSGGQEPQSQTTPQSEATPQPQAPSQTTQAITIPAGTPLLIRMIDRVDSSKNKVGDIFRASLEDQLIVGDTVVAPKGADVYGKLAEVKEAGHVSGAPRLTLELTGIRVNGRTVPIDSTEYSVVGKGRGKQSAKRIGGGALIGALIGGIAGGGTGAAIGTGVGAGAGAATQLVTHGQKLRIRSETLLEFKLQQAVAVPVQNSAQ
jgi:hypothetical protein